MSETVKIWLRDLCSEKIEETKAAIENEYCWLDGSIDEESKTAHEQNIAYLREYAEILETWKNEIER